MTLNLSLPNLSVTPKSVELVFEVGEALEEVGIKPTREKVSSLIQLAINSPESLEIDSKSLARLLVTTLIFGLQNNEPSLETKEGVLKELDFLRNNPGDVSKNRFFYFLNKVFESSNYEEIAKKLGVGTRTTSDYLLNNAWMQAMSDDLYDTMRYYINSNFT